MVARARKPIGFIKQGKSFKLVFGTKTKPRLGKKRFGSKASLLKSIKPKPKAKPKKRRKR